MRIEKDNVFKTYKAKDRNQGRDNVMLEAPTAPAKNIDEQLVERALQNLLGPSMRVAIVSDGLGPPDIDVEGQVGVEVKGHEATAGVLHWNKVGEAIQGKMADLRNAWRKNTGGRGERLRKYKECWIAVTVPLPMMWMRHQGMDNRHWEARMRRNKEELDAIIAEHVEGSSLRDPTISRVIVLLRGSFPYHPPAYVYNTNRFSTATCLPVGAFCDQPEESVVVEQALTWAGMTLTSIPIGPAGKGKIWVSNECKSILR